jgi:hypothetical protein
VAGDIARVCISRMNLAGAQSRQRGILGVCTSGRRNLSNHDRITMIHLRRSVFIIHAYMIGVSRMCVPISNRTTVARLPPATRAPSTGLVTLIYCVTCVLFPPLCISFTQFVLETGMEQDLIGSDMCVVVGSNYTATQIQRCYCL